MSKLEISICPTCGSNKIRSVRAAVKGAQHGKQYSAPGVEFHECPDCGERVYDPAAMREIEKHWPAFLKSRSLKGIA